MPRSVREWLSLFDGIYGQTNAKRRVDYLIYRLTEEVAELIGPITEIQEDQIKKHLPDVFAWVCAVASKLDMDLQRSAWDKYGSPDAPWPKGRRAVLEMYLEESSEPRTLSEWQPFIEKEYEYVNRYLTPQIALSEMIKDLGKLSKLLRTRELTELSSALASIFAWTLTLANELQIELDSLVNAKYQNVCIECGATRCECVAKPEQIRVIFASFGPSTVEREREVIKSVTEESQRTMRMRSVNIVGISLDSIIKSHNELALCDGAVVLLNGVDWSLKADITEIMANIDSRNIWFYSRVQSPNTATTEFIEDLKKLNGFPTVKTYGAFDELRFIYERDLGKK